MGLVVRPRDLRAFFDSDARELRLFRAGEQCVLAVRASDRAIGGAGFGHLARCPRGEFVLGRPEPRGQAAFGAWFLPILDYGVHHALRDHGRGGLGIHGGGSGLPDPFAPQQPLIPTEGCLRVHNGDLAVLVALVSECQAARGRVLLGVVGK